MFAERLNEAQLLKYVRRVVGSLSDGTRDRGYLLLSYHWQKHMGDLTFDPEMFPDVPGMLRKIK